MGVEVCLSYVCVLLVNISELTVVLYSPFIIWKKCVYMHLHSQNMWWVLTASLEYEWTGVIAPIKSNLFITFL